MSDNQEAGDGTENGWEWLDKKAEEELGALRSYTDSRFYSYEKGWDTETEEKTHPWLIWKPGDKYRNQEEVPYEVQVARTLEKNGYFQDWTPFDKTSGHEERFTLQRYYGSIPPHPDSKVPETVVDLCSRLNLETPDPDPVKALPTLKVMRNLARERLDGHAIDLASEVMQPLKKVLIPCAIEATKAITDSRPLHEVNGDVIKTWSETVRDLDHLWKHGIGHGISFDIIDEHENWYGRTFQHVPDPVADGAKAALKVYVGRSEEKHRDMSRDGILDRARPIYLKWEAARRMIWSTMYEWTLEEAANRSVGPLPDIFSGRQELLSHAEEIQEVYENERGSPPEDMGDLKRRIGVKGGSKVTQLQTAIREAGLSDRWENRNPESFCSFVVQLIDRHYEEYHPGMF